MYFAQFYQKSAISDAVVETCGDRGVIILDGRQCMGVMHDLSAHACKQRGYIGYTIHKGENFSRSQAITKMRWVIERPRTLVLFEKLTETKKRLCVRDVFITWVRKMAADPKCAAYSAALEYLQLTDPANYPMPQAVHVSTRDVICNLYLDWFNNFVSVPAFAAYHGLNEDEAELLIALGRKVANTVHPES